MAGRGTDILLGRGVADEGGLHVISTEPHGSGRVDRQLFGRSARQGDPGTAQMFASAEDDLFIRHARHIIKAWKLLGADRVISYAQMKAEHLATAVCVDALEGFGIPDVGVGRGVGHGQRRKG